MDKKIMHIDELRDQLKDRNLAEVARAVPCTRAYLSMIVKSERSNPSYEMLSRLSYLMSLPSTHKDNENA